MTTSSFVIRLLCAPALLLVVGCESSTSAGAGAGPSSAPPHPAMHATVSQTPASTDLPPGHPPISSSATPTGGRPGSMGGSTPAAAPSRGSSEGPGLASNLARIGLAMTLPADWIELAVEGGMRWATLRLPRVEGDTEDGELSVIPAMGSIEANVQRWSGQFQEKPKPILSTRKVGALEITLVELEGTFSAGMRPGASAAPKPGTLLLAAIVPAGQSLLFFKAWGPKKTMEHRKPEVEAFITSLRPAR